MPNVKPSPAQQELLLQLENTQTDFSSDWDTVRGGLAFARAYDLETGRDPAATQGDDNARMARVSNFLERYGSLFGVPAGMRALRLLRTRRDTLGFTHLQFQQHYGSGNDTPASRAIEVYGSKLAAHFAADGRMVEVQSSCYSDPAPVNTRKVKPEQLGAAVLKSIQRLEGYKELAARMKRQEENLFPLMQAPRLVIYPWHERMLFTWATHGYALLPKDQQEDKADARDIIAFGQMFFDAETGDLFLFAPTRKGAENPTTGSGLGTLPLGGPFTSRALQIVRQDMTNTYRLKNTTKGRPIVTFDANANSAWVYPNIPSLLDAGTIPVSEDTDGNFNWSRTAANTTDAERTASQQPETDEHATVSDIYDWYAAIGGRVGWDDNGFTGPLVPNQTLNVVSHTFDDNAGTSRSINAFFDSGLVSGHWVAHLAFFDGDPTATEPYDYLAGSKGIVAHEYQHAVTDFSFVDGMGNPGLTYSDWLAAVHEGLSDVFGGLYGGDWWMGREISSTGLIFRNLAFPRDTTCFDDSKFDHWDDRNNITGSFARYFRGDILAHAAYLMAQGGVHQRASRTPALIPVRGMGSETAGGRSVYKAARVYYRAVAEYLSNIGALTGIPANDENVFRTIRNGCVSAAIDLYGSGSLEHKTTVLAWYAVGLHPVGSNYGADCTFLTWGADWWFSKPYVGVSSPDWSSRDLFINNGGASEWNAQVNVLDSGGNPTQFENDVYFRVRNVGTSAANNVQVQFEYTKISAGGATWLPMTDKDGNIQSLNIGALAPGQSNFPDAGQDSPPATARVKWWIPPLEVGETVDHFCLRARVFSISDVNPHNSEVQSNIAYTAFVPGMMARFGFLVSNDRRQSLPLELVLSHTLPRDWKLRFLDPVQGLVLKPGETRRLHVSIDTPARAGSALEAPFDGRLRGVLSDPAIGPADGLLTQGRLNGTQLEAIVALTAADGTHVTGKFAGTLDVTSAHVDGWIDGSVQLRAGGPAKPGRIHFRGCLRPDRIVNIGQVIDGMPASGLSVQVQVPLPKGTCFEELPPTTTRVPLPPVKPDTCLTDAAELIKCLQLDARKVCSVDIRSVVLEVKFKRDGC